MKATLLRLYSSILLLALVSGLVLPYAHFHEHDHGAEHQSHWCEGSFCLANEHQEKLESCPNSTHLFCEVCDLVLPLLRSEDQVLPSVCIHFIDLPSGLSSEGVPVEVKFSSQGRAPPIEV